MIFFIFGDFNLFFGEYCNVLVIMLFDWCLVNLVLLVGKYFKVFVDLFYGLIKKVFNLLKG